MKRVLSLTFASAVATALIAAGCGTDSGSSGGGGGAADASSDSASAGATKDGAATDGAGGGKVDAVAGDATATTDAKTPCGGPCKADETCDTATDKCVAKPKVGCDPACKAGEYCDLAEKKCKTQTCKFPEKWGPTVQKVSMLKLPAGSVGCDLDGDGKPNNALSAALAAFLTQANGPLEKSVKDGTIVIAMESSNYKNDGTEFGLNMLIGDVEESNKTCDLVSATANCKYTVKPDSYDPKATTPACPPVISFPNMKNKDGQLSGGGPKQIFQFTLPITTFALTLKITQAQLQGEVAGTATWDNTKKGLICGALAKKDIEEAIDAVPDEQFASLGGKGVIKGMIGSMLKTDIDADGDGFKESASVAIQWESVKGQVTGLTPPKK
ncbi:MAG: hypothetical protein FJ100_02465 [Deltaproteobacteria bacterium]|nr:hypothetical protein [Deltaproteobacteria bacterium]